MLLMAPLHDHKGSKGYADDGCLAIVAGDSLTLNVRYLEGAMRKVDKWFDDNGLQLDLDKNCTTRRNPLNPSLTLPGCPGGWQPQVARRPLQPQDGLRRPRSGMARI